MEAFEFMKILLKGKSVLIDVNPPLLYSRGHPQGSISIPYRRKGWLDEFRSIAGPHCNTVGIFSSRADRAHSVESILETGGIKMIFVHTEGRDRWESLGLPLQKLSSISTGELKDRLHEYTVLDVREKHETSSGVINGSINIPVSEIYRRWDEIGRQGLIAVICSHGGRSRRVAVFLESRGFHVTSVNGGMASWMSRGYRTE